MIIDEKIMKICYKVNMKLFESIVSNKKNIGIPFRLVPTMGNKGKYTIRVIGDVAFLGPTRGSEVIRREKVPHKHDDGWYRNVYRCDSILQECLNKEPW